MGASGKAASAALKKAQDDQKKQDEDTANRRGAALKLYFDKQIELTDALREHGETLYDSTVKDLETVRDKIKSIAKEIGDVKKEIADLDKEEAESIADRVVEIRKELLDYTISGDKRLAITKELAIALKNTTPEEIAQANIRANESPTEKIIRETKEKRSELQTQLADYEAQLLEQEKLLEKDLATKAAFEQYYTVVYKEQLDERLKADAEYYEKRRKIQGEIVEAQIGLAETGAVLSPQ